MFHSARIHTDLGNKTLHVSLVAELTQYNLSGQYLMDTDSSSHAFPCALPLTFGEGESLIV